MVSIIITYIDEHAFLREAIQSAFVQTTNEPFEIILVCNSKSIPDNDTRLVIQDPRIIFIHEPVTGSAHARNAGLKTATGEWIQFLDVDDLLLPGKIAHQLSSGNGHVIVSPHIYQYLNGKKIMSAWAPDDLWAGMLGGHVGSTSSMLWQKNMLFEIGGWNIDYQSHQEYELLFRAASRGYKIIPFDQAETIVRERKSGSITQMTKSSRAEQGIKLREQIRHYLVENKMDTPARLNAFRQYIFRQLRATYRRNPKDTMKIFNQYFQNGKFTPEKIGIPLYNTIYRLAGFKRTEDLFSFYSTTRNKYLPFLPINK
ncbi:MAG: glycosyltransferase family A protein [Saprospiraceae bacterium]